MTKGIKENWTWVASFSYLYLIFNGMFYSWERFDGYGINIFQFTEISDFLIVPFREPLVFATATLIIGWGMLMILSHWLNEKALNYLKAKASSMSTPSTLISFLLSAFGLLLKFNKPFFYVALLFLILASPFMASRMAVTIFPDLAVRMNLELSQRYTLHTKDFFDHKKTEKKVIENLKLIGTTNRYTFFRTSNDENLIVSNSNVAGLVLSSPHKAINGTQ